jgi:hypothetical protein
MARLNLILRHRFEKEIAEHQDDTRFANRFPRADSGTAKEK